MAQPSAYPFQSQVAQQWNTSLEWRLQRIEKENALLFSENQRLQTSYSEALDKLAKQLVKALVQQQISQYQGMVWCRKFIISIRKNAEINKNILKAIKP